MIYQGLQAAADKVAEDTDGHVKVTIYPSSQLGGEEDMIDQALQGMGIAVLTDAGRLSSYVNDIGIIILPDKHPVFISVFVTGAHGSILDAEKTIADLSQAAWDYYTSERNGNPIDIAERGVRDLLRLENQP